jgi:hypothetical protein
VLSKREEKRRLDLIKQRVCAKISRSCDRNGFCKEKKEKKKKKEEIRQMKKGWIQKVFDWTR